MKFRTSSLFTLFVIVFFLVALLTSLSWSLRASILVLVLGGVALVLALIQLYLELRPEAEDLGVMDTPAIPWSQWRGMAITWGWLLGMLASIWIFSFKVTVPLFVFLYSKIYGARWYTSLILAAAAFGFLYVLFDQMAHVIWPESLLFSLISG